MTLLFSEVKDLNVQVPHLITTLQLAAERARDKTASEAEKDRGVAAFDKLVIIGDRLTVELLGKRTPTLVDLLNKWTDHAYRPSLHAKRGTPEKLLADIYDLVARIYGYDVQAYRCGFNADGVR